MANGTYTLSFSYAGNAEPDVAPRHAKSTFKTLQLYWDGELIGAYSEHHVSNTRLQKQRTSPHVLSHTLSLFTLWATDECGCWSDG